MSTSVCALVETHGSKALYVNRSVRIGSGDPEGKQQQGGKRSQRLGNVFPEGVITNLECG